MSDNRYKKKFGLIKKKNADSSYRCVIYVDGTALDKATRRIEKRIDLSKLISEIHTVTGTPIETVVETKYYTIIPNEDDSRQRSFLNAVEYAGFTTEIVRLPPKGIKKFVTVDVQLSADIVNFGNCYQNDDGVKRVILVCPSKELLYPVSLIKGENTEIIAIDFSRQSLSKQGSKTVADIANSSFDFSVKENIWRY